MKEKEVVEKKCNNSRGVRTAVEQYSWLKGRDGVCEWCMDYIIGMIRMLLV